MKIKNYIVYGFWIVLSFVFISMSFYRLIQIENFGNVFSICMDQSLSNNEGNKLLEAITTGENMQAVIWGEEQNVTVKNIELNREMKLDKIRVCGQPDLLYGEQDIPYFDEKDLSGCIIDEKIADGLFGSINVIGKKIVHLGREYVIRSVIQENRGVFIVRGVDDEQEIFDKINILNKGSAKIEELNSKLHTAYGVNGNIIDYQLMVDIAHMFYWVTFALFTVLIWQCCSFARCDKGGYTYYTRYIVRITILFIVVVIVLYRFPVSENFIPTKWSDFDFWSKLFAEKQVSLLSFIRIEKSFYEMDFIKKYLFFIIYKWMGDFFLLLTIVFSSPRFKRMNSIT